MVGDFKQLASPLDCWRPDLLRGPVFKEMPLSIYPLSLLVCEQDSRSLQFHLFYIVVNNDTHQKGGNEQGAKEDIADEINDSPCGCIGLWLHALTHRVHSQQHSVLYITALH